MLTTRTLHVAAVLALSCLVSCSDDDETGERTIGSGGTTAGGGAASTSGGNTTGGASASGGVPTGGTPTGGTTTGGTSSTTGCDPVDARMDCVDCMTQFCCESMNACAADVSCAALTSCLLDNVCYQSGDIASCAQVYCAEHASALPLVEAYNDCLVVSCLVPGHC